MMPIMMTDEALRELAAGGAGGGAVRLPAGVGAEGLAGLAKQLHSEMASSAEAAAAWAKGLAKGFFGGKKQRKAKRVAPAKTLDTSVCAPLSLDTSVCAPVSSVDKENEAASAPAPPKAPTPPKARK